MSTGPDRSQAWCAAALALVIGGLACWASAEAPVGRWQNEIFATPAWGEADPGVWYVFRAHDLTREGPPAYHGHPGTPLLLALRALQQAQVAIAAPDGVEPSRFLAQRLPDVLLAAKGLTTAVHLLSFWLLFLASRAALGDARAALLGTCVYATSLPTLYYLSRVSVEPWMACFLAATWLAIWRYEDAMGVGARVKALAWIAGAGVAATSAVVSKLALIGPLPLGAALWLALGPHSRALPAATRVTAIGVFTAASVATLAFYSQWIDWGSFLAYWRGLAATPQLPQTARGLLPGLSAWNLFPTSETLVLVLALVGAASAARSRALALAACAVFGALVFGYRVLLAGSFLPFHYAFLLLWGAAPFAGAQLARLQPRGWALPLAAVLLLHGVAIAAVVDSRLRDAEHFAPHREAWSWLGRLEADQQLVVVNPKRPHRPLTPDAIGRRAADLSGWPAAGLLGIGGPPPSLHTALTGLFRPRYQGAPVGDREHLEVPALRATLIAPAP